MRWGFKLNHTSPLNMSTSIYILQCRDSCWYIGKSDNPMRRYQEHLEGRGSAWTRLHRPIRVERIISSNSPFDEDRYTKEYMIKYGIDNVRGGSYANINLDVFQIVSLSRELMTTNDLCFNCGENGHFANSCMNLIEEYSKDDEPPDTCYRCGRQGHYKSECYARTDVMGRFL